ncbi:MAG: mannose-1-phosphate guanylyltransferase [Candidatus Marinimicrobia bacterium]|nr:mannose-1-phosphate guanylyltransferase [Candidatus Neomarinimicrobiota bacterium]
MHCVIMAGGAGTRFWPKSRRKRPKQLLELFNGKSLIAQTAHRLAKYPGSDGLYVAASDHLVKSIQNSVDGITRTDCFIEPGARNTAPAIALAAFVLRKRCGDDAVMGVFPADHLIKNDKEFQRALSLAEKKALEGPNLVTLGIQPDFPATGYGYVEFNRVKASDVHPVVRFTEKPDLETAKSFLEGGYHLWNGGMFVWQVSTILDNIAEHLPATYDNLASIENLIDTPKFMDALTEIWPVVDSISIDYGVLENASNIFTVETRFDWNDLGSWRTLYDVLPKDTDGNVVQGDATVLDSKNSIVLSEGHYTAVIGAEDLVVVSMADATIVLPRSQSERVQEVVHWLKSREREELL